MSAVESKPVYAEADTNENVYVTIMLHYDTYYPSINLTEMHATFEASLAWLRNIGFPMEKLLVVTWRNTFDNEAEYTWLMNTSSKYGIYVNVGQFGLFMAPEDTHDPNVLSYALETFRNRMGTYPFFVAGFSASSNTYSSLVNDDVKLSFFNLWEEGEDYSYRGYSTGDELFGANWEGSPFQPYKPSKHTANAPATTKEHELDIWEAHWITRNPSYAFLAVNSRNWGSIHPSDLLMGDWGVKVDSSKAFKKLNTMLDLIDQNAKNNPIIAVSYPVECSLLRRSDVSDTWRASIKEFIQRDYKVVDAVEVRSILDSLEAEQTPLVCVWIDNQTSSDLVVAGEHTPFALLSSAYGRFIYGRRDPLNDSGTPFISITSYLTAKAYNESFQSIRELTGVGEMKMNTFVSGIPLDVRWQNDVSTVKIYVGKAVAIKWQYSKGELSNVEHKINTYLTPYGVLLEKEILFTKPVTAQVSIVQYLTVQSNTPTPFIDGDTRVETDSGDVFSFSTTNPQTIEKDCPINDTIMFTATDGYTLGVTITSGKPDLVRVFDEAGGSTHQTLEFLYHNRTYEKGEKIQLSYALIPATNLSNSRKLAEDVITLIQGIESQEQTNYYLYGIVIIAVSLIVLITIVKFWNRFFKFSSCHEKKCLGLLFLTR